MPVIELLADDISAIAIDLPGHGRSGDWSADNGDLHALSGRIAITFCEGRTDVVGHSFGAAVALRLAVDRPDLVRRLVLVEPVFFAAAEGTEARARHDAAFQPFADAMAAGDRERATRIFADMWGGGQSFDDLPAAQQQAMIDRIHLIQASTPGIVEDSGNLMRRMNLAIAPALLISGTDSSDVIDAVHDGLAGVMPDARRIVIEGAGHMSPLTHPREVAGAIRDHLQIDKPERRCSPNHG